METNKQAKELNKTTQDPKIEVETKKDTTKGDSSGDRNHRKEIMSHRFEHHQQKTSDGSENLRCRRFLRKHGQKNKRMCKMQKDPNPKLPGNPGHNEKTKPKDNSYRCE